jgi:predicted ATPase
VRQFDAQIEEILDPEEEIQSRTWAVGALVAITDRRLMVSTHARLALNVAISRIRRIELNIERNRLATLIIVPESPRDDPQVLSIPAEEYEAAIQAVALIGGRLLAT